MSRPFPQKICFYWYGDGPPSWLRKQTISTFMIHHRGWEVTTVRENTSGDISVCVTGSDGGKTITEKADWYTRAEAKCPPDMRADLFRWQYLYRFGGWFADLDILFFRPLPELTGSFATTRSGGTHGLHGDFAIGLVASQKNSPLAGEVLARSMALVGACHRIADHQMCGSRLLAKECLQFESRSGSKIVDIPASWVYPHGFSSSNNRSIWDEKRNLDRHLNHPSIGLHWGGGHAVSRNKEKRADDLWARVSDCLVAKAWRFGMTPPSKHKDKHHA